MPPKSTATRATNSAKSSESKENANSESDLDATQKVMRKLTRSSSTRKSKHLTAIFNPGKASDSETESESKRSVTKSPVKRGPATTKGKSKNSKTNSKTNSHVSSPVKRTPAVPEERRCLVDGCNSNGHLGGRLDKHFTEEACPLFHSVPLPDTKTQATDRTRRNEDRKNAAILLDPEKKPPTVEQKAYQLKIRDVRNKFATSTGSPTRSPSIGLNNHRGDVREYREPKLTGLVSDYDLQLFREAQAVASEKIEDELKDLPAGKGTK